MASLNVTTQDSVTLKLTETTTVAGQSLSNNYQFPTSTYSTTFATSTGGTVASVTDLWWAAGSGTGVVTLASSASTTYTLSALTDDLGRTIAFLRVRYILLQVTSSTGNDFLTIGAAAANPWVSPFGGTTPVVKIRNLWHVVDNSPAALVVASGSNDQLKIVNSGSASMTFSLVLVGNST